MDCAEIRDDSLMLDFQNSMLPENANMIINHRDASQLTEDEKDTRCSIKDNCNGIIKCNILPINIFYIYEVYHSNSLLCWKELMQKSVKKSVCALRPFCQLLIFQR